MKKLIFLIPLILSAGIPNNGFTITNNTGATVFQPYKFVRMFAQGEIQNYPQPIGYTQWQSEVKTRWPDGKQIVTITGVSNTAPIHVTTATDHGFKNGYRVCLSGLGGGNTNADGCKLIYNISARGFDLVNSTGNGTYTSGGIATGPKLGSVQHAFIYVWVPVGATPVTVNFTNNTNACHLGNETVCAAAGLGATGILAFNGGNWGAAMQATQNGETFTRDAKTFINDGNFTYWAKGPIATEIIAEDRTQARSYDFGWHCASTFKITADTVSDTFFTWDLATGTIPTNHNFTVNRQVSFVTPAGTGGPQPVTSAGFGPVRFIVNPSGNSFQVSNSSNGPVVDITSGGTNPSYITACGSGDYTDVTWDNDTPDKSLHPQYILTFFPGWAGVYIEYIMQNGWSTHLQDTRYTISLYKDNSNITLAKTINIPQFSRTEWVWREWSGTPTTLTFPTSSQIFTAALNPPNFSIDINKQYIVYSKMTPAFDATQGITTAGVNTAVANYQSGVDVTRNPFYCLPTTLCMQFTEAFAGTGGRPELGWAPRWNIQYLLSSSSKLFYILIGEGDIAGTVPYHFWESGSGKWYDMAHTIDGFGLPLSVNARPSLRLYYPSTQDLDVTGVATADRIICADVVPPTGGPSCRTMASTQVGWIPEYSGYYPAHQPSFHYMPYMLTGDYFYLEDGLAYVQQYTFGQATTLRHNDWGLSTTTADRGNGWGIRSMMQMAVMSPDFNKDGTVFASKNYYKERVDAMTADFEAIFGTKAGRYTKTCDINTFNRLTETSYYCWSLLTKTNANNDDNLLKMPLPSIPDYANGNGIFASAYPPYRALYNMWQASIPMLILGWGAEVGFNTDAIVAQNLGLWIEVVNSKPKFTEEYLIPVQEYRTAAALASNITNSQTTIPLSSIPAWGMTPPYAVQIHTNLAANPGTSEWVWVCSVTNGTPVSGATLNLCTNGRGAVPFGLRTGSPGSVIAHNGNGALCNTGVTVSSCVEPGDMSPLFHRVTDIYNASATAVQSRVDSAASFTTFTASTGFSWAGLSLQALSYGAKSWYNGKAGFAAYNTLMGYRQANLTTFGNTYQGIIDANPHMIFVLRRDPVTNVTAQTGDTFVIIRYKAPSAGFADSPCTVDGVSDGQSTSIDRYFVKTGLTPSTNYTSTIHCDGDHYNNGNGLGNEIVNYRTAATFSGTASLSRRIGGSGSTATLAYGTTTALGTTTTGSCASGCTLATTISKGLYYTQIYRDGVPTGKIQPTVVQ